MQIFVKTLCINFLSFLTFFFLIEQQPKQNFQTTYDVCSGKAVFSKAKGKRNCCFHFGFSLKCYFFELRFFFFLFFSFIFFIQSKLINLNTFKIFCFTFFANKNNTKCINREHALEPCQIQRKHFNAPILKIKQKENEREHSRSGSIQKWVDDKFPSIKT